MRFISIFFDEKVVQKSYSTNHAAAKTKAQISPETISNRPDSPNPKGTILITFSSCRDDMYLSRFLYVKVVQIAPFFPSKNKKEMRNSYSPKKYLFG